MRRAGMLLCLLTMGAGLQMREPITIHAGPPHTPSVVYGPADMLCDLYTCRLFNLPSQLGLARGTIVAFGLPTLDGQDRVNLRRCFQVCRASVLGYEIDAAVPRAASNPTISINPIEIRLE
jgi:hypothetical protein